MDYSIKIAVCRRKTDRQYVNQMATWSSLRERNRSPVRTPETAAQYQTLPKPERDAAKDQGGFVGGWLRDGLRKNGCVLSRCVGALDADSIPAGEDFPARVRLALPDVTYFLYSTHSHTPAAQRYRVIVLLGREVSEDEYPALMRMVASHIGLSFFDETTFQANRMMYWASCPSDGDFVFDENDGAPLDPDSYLAKYPDWRDVTQWPTTARQTETLRRSVTQQQDPLAKSSIVGVFCRAYHPIGRALDTLLSDVYAPSRHAGRYDYKPAESVAGVVLYGDSHAYSHHATDPACGRLLNAFDLVRIHRFGDLDEKASYKAMCDYALTLDAVKLQLDAERQAATEAVAEETELDWKTRLTYTARGQTLENTVWNLMLIFSHDPDFAAFAYNELAHRVQVRGAVPWDRPTDNTYWRDADTAQLKALIDVRYLPFSSRNHDVCFTKAADDRRFHPIRDYLDALPPWDGTPRVESLFVRCLLADDTPYVRAVSRKTFAAAVARIYRPGTKFDCVPVFDGAQGIGKSTLFKDLVGDEYYSETLSLTDMDDKSGAEKLQGFWVVEIGELAGMKKADIEKVKAFLSTSDDKYRPSYGKTVESHQRQCIIIATVNGERGYLRDITGNRRFWVVKCHQEEQVKRWRFTPEERDQIWAEAKHIWESGEKLYLDIDMIPAAEQAQRDAMEMDERQGMVEEYLDALLPDDWDKQDIYSRREHFLASAKPLRGEPSVRRDTVCNAEIWCECFGRNLSDLKPADSYAIAALMTRIGGWVRTKETKRLSQYGRQRLYRRACVGGET